MDQMKNEILRDLAPTGILRAGLNLSNFLLVSRQRSDGTPEGVSPDIARYIASVLEVPCKFVLFDSPSQLADAAVDDLWDIGNIAYEPKRAKQINFSNPYALIDANFLVSSNSSIGSYDEVDQIGVKIAAFSGSAYELWLTENITKADIVHYQSIEESHKKFYQGEVEVLASLKPKLLDEISPNREVRIIEPSFTAIKQAVGIKKHNPAVISFINEIISKVISNGFISDSLKKHGVENKLSLPNLEK